MDLIGTNVIDRTDWALAEGAVIERLRRDPRIELHPDLLNAPLIYDREARSMTADIQREYAAIAHRCGRPIILLSPTWRAGRNRVEASGFRGRDLNGDAVRFVRENRVDFSGEESSILVGGLLGPKGDAYRPEEAPSRKEAASFHAWQARRLAAAGPDFLMAATLPASAEAVGMAEAMAATGQPYIVSFVIRPAGTLLDGTPLPAVMRTIDAEVRPRPWMFMVNCVHPGHVLTALRGFPTDLAGRLGGLQGNTSALSPEELDGSDRIHADPPETWARDMVRLHREHGFKILGGCCGSDHRHIQALAARLSG